MKKCLTLDEKSVTKIKVLRWSLAEFVSISTVSEPGRFGFLNDTETGITISFHFNFFVTGSERTLWLKVKKSHRGVQLPQHTLEKMIARWKSAAWKRVREREVRELRGRQRVREGGREWEREEGEREREKRANPSAQRGAILFWSSMFELLSLKMYLKLLPVVLRLTSLAGWQCY